MFTLSLFNIVQNSTVLSSLFLKLHAIQYDILLYVVSMIPQGKRQNFILYVDLVSVEGTGN